MQPTRLNELLIATGGTAVGGADPELLFDRVVIDSRQVRPGSVFWALEGSQRHGHDFIADALEQGASFCVTERTCERSDEPIVLVDDALVALRDLARWHQARCDSLIIGVTGSVGKTTAREMIHAVLAESHIGIRSRGNLNNEIGLPLSLLEVDDTHEYGILEMGACQPGDIRKLCGIAAPEIGVITGIAASHLASFGDLSQVAATKGELIEQLPASGIAILAADTPAVRQLAERACCRVVFVGEQSHNQIRAERVVVGQRRLSFCVDGFRYEVPASGRHHLTGALCGVAVGRELGMRPADIAAGLLNFSSLPGRCDVHQVGSLTVIDDSYNASPASMEAACQLLSHWSTAGKKLVVLGDMLEMGTESPIFHRELGNQIVEAGVDFAILFGDEAAHVALGAITAGMAPHQLAECRDFDSLLTVLDCWLDPGDVVLVKGSRGMRMERALDWIRNTFETETNAHSLCPHIGTRLGNSSTACIGFAGIQNTTQLVGRSNYS